MPNIQGTDVCHMLLLKSIIFFASVVETAGSNIPKVYVLNFSSR